MVKKGENLTDGNIAETGKPKVSGEVLKVPKSEIDVDNREARIGRLRLQAQAEGITLEELLNKVGTEGVPAVPAATLEGALAQAEAEHLNPKESLKLVVNLIQERKINLDNSKDAKELTDIALNASEYSKKNQN